MHITDYFEPIDFSLCHPGGSPPERYLLGPSVGRATRRFLEGASDKPDVVIIGVPFDHGQPQEQGHQVPDTIRRQLYNLAPVGSGLRIADAGNLRAPTSARGLFLALRDVIESLQQQGIVVVVLGGSQELSLGIAETYKNRARTGVSVIDARLDLKREPGPVNASNFLSRLLRILPKLSQFSLIGYQSHLVGEWLLNKTKRTGQHLRLGELRDDITEAELLLRTTHLLSFDLGAVRYADAPATTQKNPNGLQGEEACQLARYAGLSPCLEVFGLFEGTAEDPGPELTSQLSAEIVWYFLEGLTHRKPAGAGTRYKVAVEGLEEPMIFKHEEDPDRWWMEIHSITGELFEIACSRNDYLLAAGNEIPDRWLTSVQKMDQLLK